jgi:hypothetical protein
MPLSDEDIQRIKDWLSARNAFPLRCPICTAAEWYTDLIALPLHNGGSSRSLLLICRECGYQMIFDALTMGLAID